MHISLVTYNVTLAASFCKISLACSHKTGAQTAYSQLGKVGHNLGKKSAINKREDQ